jgi:hypothetical protein
MDGSRDDTGRQTLENKSQCSPKQPPGDHQRKLGNELRKFTGAQMLIRVTVPKRYKTPKDI